MSHLRLTTKVSHSLYPIQFKFCFVSPLKTRYLFYEEDLAKNGGNTKFQPQSHTSDTLFNLNICLEGLCSNDFIEESKNTG